MIDTLGAWFPLLSFVLPLIALNGYFIREAYKNSVTALEAHKNAVKIQPKRSRFLFSWSIFYLGTVMPAFAVLWLLPINKGIFTFFVTYLLPIFWVIGYFLSYPDFTLTIDDAKLSGPPLWQWGQKRVEIDLHEIDKQKVLQQNLGRRVGIVVFESAKGLKIFALGLDSLQIQKIFDAASLKTL